MKKYGVLAAAAALVYVAASCAHQPTDPKTLLQSQKNVSQVEQRAPSENEEETPWTTWSKKGTLGGLKVLGHIRENLLKENLHDPHVSYTSYRQVDCSKMNTNFRSADGSCTDLEKPWVGASGVAFGRNVPPKFIDQQAAEKLQTPNPAEISKEFLTRDDFKPVPFLNMLAASWIQFMNHDWLTHGENMEKDPYKVRVDDGSEKEVDRTKENLHDSRQYDKQFGIVTINEATHWWDASQIYGSNQEEQSQVRSFEKGKLKTVLVNGRELLPKDETLNSEKNRRNRGYEITGLRDNWWVGLSMLHHLFVKEHNAIAEMLMKKHVQHDEKIGKWVWKNRKEVKVLDDKELDEQIFQTARLVNAAVLAKIHTTEWTPAILSNPTLKIAMHVNWSGLLNPSTWLMFTRYFPGISKTDWFEHTATGYVIGGIVGDKPNNFGVPFSITEEFTAVYRLHSLLPEELNLRRLAQKDKVTPIKFPDTRNDRAYGIMGDYDLKDLFYSFGVQHPGQLVLNNFPKFMQDMTVPGYRNIDLGLVDILRDRERGVPRYNQFRRALQLRPIKSYRDFFPADKELDARQQAILEKFYRIYGKDASGKDNVELIDLMVGTLAEEVRPAGFGFGETMFQIFILMASRRLMADRFFTSYYRKEYYTPSGLKWIDQQGTLSQVIGRHMPELKKHMRGLETAFRPWTDEYRYGGTIVRPAEIHERP